MALLIIKILWTVLCVIFTLVFGLMFTVGSVLAHKEEPNFCKLIFHFLFGVSIFVIMGTLLVDVWKYF